MPPIFIVYIYYPACEFYYVDKKIATLTDNEKSYFTDANLKSGEKYYYKVRVFKELNGEICFGQYSHILCVYTKK